MELKIKYKQSSIISLTVLFDKNLKSFLNKIKKMNEISISKILNKETPNVEHFRKYVENSFQVKSN